MSSTPSARSFELSFPGLVLCCICFALSDVGSRVRYGCFTSTDNADPSFARRKMMSALSQDWPNQGV